VWRSVKNERQQIPANACFRFTLARGLNCGQEAVSHGDVDYVIDAVYTTRIVISAVITGPLNRIDGIL
jgi:hypothetical protein